VAIREVIGDDGRAWTIYAIVPDAYDDRIGIAAGYMRGWLCFHGPAEKRRLLGIPSRWEHLDAMDLLSMLDETILAPTCAQRVRRLQADAPSPLPSEAQRCA